MDKLVIIGAKQKAKDVMDFVNRFKLFEVIGFSVNEAYMKHDTFCGLPCYKLEELHKHVNKSKVYTFVGASEFNYLNRVKRDLYNYLKENGWLVANLIAPTAMIYSNDIGDGNWIAEYAAIGEDVKVGSNNVMRPFSYLGHFGSMENHNYISINATIGGGVHIGSQCFVGLNATIFNSLKIGNKCIIGAGTAVRKNVPDYCVCKLMSDNVIVHEYDSERIERKLAPIAQYPRSDYDTVKR